MSTEPKFDPDFCADSCVVGASVCPHAGALGDYLLKYRTGDGLINDQVSTDGLSRTWSLSFWSFKEHFTRYSLVAMVQLLGYEAATTEDEIASTSMPHATAAAR